MIYLQRKLKCKYVGSNDFQPEGIPANKWMIVIGYETIRREKRFGEKTETVDDLYFFVVNDKGKISKIAQFNCQVMIDEASELNTAQLTMLLNNILTIGKNLSETMANQNHSNGGNPG